MSGSTLRTIRQMRRKKPLRQRIWENRYIYLLLLPGLLFFIIFKYVPIYGLQLAFKRYQVNLGINMSPWNGVDNFRLLFVDGDFWKSVRNTLVIAYLQILLFFPFPILLSILLNEVRQTRLKKVVQTIYTLPHFLSWVIVSGMVLNMLSSNGAINNLLAVMGLERVHHRHLCISHHLPAPRQFRCQHGCWPLQGFNKLHPSFDHQLDLRAHQWNRHCLRGNRHGTIQIQKAPSSGMQLV